MIDEGIIMNFSLIINKLKNDIYNPLLVRLTSSNCLDKHLMDLRRLCCWRKNRRERIAGLQYSCKSLLINDANYFRTER
jgi:hypothetical protein